MLTKSSRQKVASMRSYLFKNSRTILICFLFLGLFLFKCANVVAPTGGEKDSAPPFVVFTSPPNYQTQFYPQKVTFHFNEWIQLTDPKKACLLSPPTNALQDIWTVNKKLYVRFKPNLLPNTTYTLQIGNGIADYTEKNPAIPYTYILSTGTHIDTGFVKGFVYHYLGKRPVDNYLVLLYSPSRFHWDSLPDAISRVYQGYFYLPALKSQPYLIFAIQDKDGNFRYTPGEWVALSPRKTITPNDSITLYTFLPDEKGPLLKQWQISQDSTQISFLFNEPISQLYISSPYFFSIPKLQQEKATLFLKKPIPDSISIQLIISDTLQNQTDTTLSLPPMKPHKFPPLSFQFSLNPIRKLLIVQPSLPIPPSQIDQFLTLRDSITLFRPQIAYWKPDEFALELSSSMKPKQTYWITVDTQLTTIFHTHLDTPIRWTFTLPLPPVPAKVSGTILDSDTLNATYWLISNQKDTIPIQTSFNLTLYNEGTYQVWKLIDTNHNQKWDNGKLSSWQPPEIWIPFQPTLQIKSGWQYTNLRFTPQSPPSTPTLQISTKFP